MNGKDAAILTVCVIAITFVFIICASRFYAKCNADISSSESFELIEQDLKRIATDLEAR